MSEVAPSLLANAIMSKLYDVLTNGDETVPSSEDNFFSWNTPGIPVEVSDFDFLTQGLTGVVKKVALDEMRTAGATSPMAEGAPPAPESPTSGPELTPELLNQLRAEDAGRMYAQAESFARLVDFSPDVTRVENDQFAKLSILNNEGTLSEIYEYILRMSQVMSTELPPETKAKIEKLQQKLTVKKLKKNILDDTDVEVTEPSPLTQLYFDKMAAYENAALEYNARRIDALAASDPKSVHYWAMNANILRNRVKAAMADWVSTGYKNEYEQIAAFIGQVSERDMTLLKQKYRDDLEKARLTGLSSGSDFFYTSLAPASFARSSGWTRFKFDSADFERHSSSSYSHKRWKTQSGGSFFGVFGGGGQSSSSKSHSEYQGKFESNRFGLTFEICQVPIVRPWFKASFLNCKTWRFDQNNPEARTEMVSDGGAPPKGLLPAYPTAAIFIRNLTLSIGHSEGFKTWVEDHQRRSAGGGGFVGFGPVSLAGSSSRSSSSGSSQSDSRYQWTKEGMEVPGMQIAGFKCHVLPKSPNPLPNISKWV